MDARTRKNEPRDDNTRVRTSDRRGGANVERLPTIHGVRTALAFGVTRGASRAKLRGRPLAPCRPAPPHLTTLPLHPLIAARITPSAGFPRGENEPSLGPSPGPGALNHFHQNAPAIQSWPSIASTIAA